MKPSPAKVFEEIGLTLCQLQTVEEVMSLCLTALQCNPAMTVIELMALDAANRKSTLGRLIRLMKETVAIEPDFVTALDRYLVARNLFVHKRFLHADFHPLRSERARINALTFIEALRADCLVLNGVFMRYACEMMTALNKEFPEKFFSTLNDQVYGPSTNPLNVEFSVPSGPSGSTLET